MLSIPAYKAENYSTESNDADKQGAQTRSTRHITSTFPVNVHGSVRSL